MRKRTAVSKFWGLDPSKLEGKTLQELHILLVERNYRAPLPGTVEEAIQILSREWRGQ